MKKILLSLCVCAALIGSVAWADCPVPINEPVMGGAFNVGPAPDSVVASIWYNGNPIDTVWLSEVSGMPGHYSREGYELGCDSLLPVTIYIRAHWGSDTCVTVQTYNPLTGIIMSLLADSLNVARDATKTDYQSTTGPGAIPVRIYAYDSLNAVAVEGVFIRVLTTGGTPKHNMTTGSDGWASGTLGTGDRLLYARHSNYTFTTPADTITVPSDSLRDTIWATEISPSAPDSSGTCLVYGHLRDLRGYSIRDAMVRLDLVFEGLGDSVFVDTLAGVEVIPYGNEVRTDATGYWELIRIPNARIQLPWGTRYKYTATLDGVTIEGHYRIVTIPDQASINIINLLK